MGEHSKDIQQILELNKQLISASDDYYKNGVEKISNYEYDKLYDELVNLQEKTGFIPKNSVTTKPGSDSIKNFAKVKHASKILSLDKTKDPTGLIKLLGDNSGCLSWKLDGLTAVLTYENGKLVSSVTRGNGIIGDDIIKQTECFSNVPKTIPNKNKVIIRGELLMSYKEFERINAETNDGQLYKNPRNLTSGTIHCLDLDVVKSRNINFVAFTSMTRLGDTYIDSLAKLKAYGFTVVDYCDVTKQNIIDRINEYTEKVKNGYIYPVDGLVLYINDYKLQDKLGSNNHHPKYALAFKWQDETKNTILRDIEWNRSRSGRINPIAIFDPVEIDGTIIKKASLHNLTYIEDMKLGIGDKISIYKANMIIPQVAINHTKSLKYISTIIPKVCPNCGGATKIVKENNSAFLICDNKNCSDILVDSILLMLNNFEVKGVAKKTLQKLVNNNVLNCREDIFKLNEKSIKDSFTAIEGLGKKSYDSFVRALNNMEVTEAMFLASLGVPMVGLQNAKLVCKEYNLNDIINRTNDYSKIDGMGSIISDNINKYMSDNKDEINNLKKYIKFKKEGISKMNNKFINSKRFAVTGSLSQFSNRKELQEIIETNGGIFGGMSKTTDYLITNTPNSGTAKNKKAAEYGTKLITEEEFIKLTNL